MQYKVEFEKRNAMKKRIFFLILFALLYTTLANAQPLKVYFGIYINSLSVNYKNSSFTADFYWWFRYESNLEKYKLKKEDVESFEYVNCLDIKKSVLEDLQDSSLNQSRNEFYLTGRTKGTFTFSPDFKDYPIDVQKLSVQIENIKLESKKLLLVMDTLSYAKSNLAKDKWGMSKEMANKEISNFRIDKSYFRVVNYTYDTDFGEVSLNQPESEYSRIEYVVEYSRNAISYLMKIIIPLFIILLLAYLVFYIPADRIDVAAGLTVTSLLGAIAFQITCSSDISDVGYLTYLDKVFYVSYLLIAYAMAQSLYTYYLELGDEKRKRISYNIEIISRYAFLTSFALGCYLLSL